MRSGREQLEFSWEARRWELLQWESGMSLKGKRLFQGEKTGKNPGKGERTGRCLNTTQPFALCPVIFVALGRHVVVVSRPSPPIPVLQVFSDRKRGNSSQMKDQLGEQVPGN